MTDSEVNRIAHRVVEIMNLASTPVDNGCVMSGPPKQAIDEKKIEEVIEHCHNAIISNLLTDEEQFVAINKLRNQMARYWDGQFSTSRDIVNFNENRANSLGKFIELTVPR